jgi:hypothetical protein
MKCCYLFFPDESFFCHEDTKSQRYYQAGEKYHFCEALSLGDLVAFFLGHYGADSIY